MNACGELRVEVNVVAPGVDACVGKVDGPSRHIAAVHAWLLCCALASDVGVKAGGMAHIYSIRLLKYVAESCLTHIPPCRDGVL